MAALCSTSSAVTVVSGRRSTARAIYSFATLKFGAPLHSVGRISKSRWRVEMRAAGVEEDDSTGSKAQQLWRKELRSSGEMMTDFESFNGEIDRSLSMERDIARMAKKEEMEKLLKESLDGNPDVPSGGQRQGGVVRDITEKILVADFFFILFSLAWLVAGLVEQAAGDSSNLIDAWLPLWPSVFQPAMGVFMAGAIVSAISKKL